MNNSKIVKPRDGISNFRRPTRGIRAGAAGVALGVSVLYGIQSLAQPYTQDSVVVHENPSTEEVDKVVTEPINDTVSPSSKTLTQKMAESSDRFSIYTLGDSQPFATCEIPSIDFKTKGGMGQRLENCLEEKIGDVSGEVVVRNIGVPFDLTRGDIQYNNNEFSNLIEKQYKNTQDQTAKVWVIPRQIDGSKIVVEDYNDFAEPPKTSIVKSEETQAYSFNGKFKADINVDGYVDEFSPTGKGITKVIDGKSGDLTEVPTVKLREYFLGKVFDYDGVHQTDESKVSELSSYVAAKDNGGREILEYMVMTNDDKIAQGTKLGNAYQFGKLVDKVANAHVRGNFVENHFMYEGESGDFDAKFSAENQHQGIAYTSTVGQDISGLDLALRHGVGSSVYETVKRDFMPLVEENAALVQNRGAGLNEGILYINEGNKEDLSQRVMRVYDKQVSMYDAQVKATQQKVEDLQRF